MTHILIVDDDPAICDLLGSYLTSENFTVSLAGSGAAMRQALAKQIPDLILLDLRLPDQDGLALASEIRTHSNTPIIMLTGRGDVVDRILGLEMGADDYIAKPFHLREVLARIKTIMRRADINKQFHSAPRAEGFHKDILQFSDWQVDLVRQKLTSPKGQNVPLTSGDFRLLEIFLRHPHQILSRDRLLDMIVGRKMQNPFDRSVDTRVRRLRLKIENNPSDPEFIKSIRGEGYEFAALVERVKADS
jgi:two-component system OmpR family response regulator